jgi:hypothetical protein
VELPQPAPEDAGAGRVPGRLRRWLSTAGFIVIALLVFLTVLEVGARWTLPVEYQRSAMYVYDPEILFRPNPGSAFARVVQLSPTEFSVIRGRVSSQGLREDYIGPKPTGEFRILLLGDSYTFGGTVEVDDTIGGRLQSLLSEKYPQRRFRVINAGVGGTGPWQQRVLLERIGFGLEPDVVLHQLFSGNDVANSATALGERLEACLPDWEYSVSRWRMDRHARFRAESWLRAHSTAYSALRRAIGRERMDHFIAGGMGFLPKAEAPEMPRSALRPDTMETNLVEWYPALDRAWGRFTDDIAGIATDCLDRNVRYAVYDIPALHELDEAVWAVASDGPDHHPLYERDKGRWLLQEALSRIGVPYINTAERLLTHEQRQGLYFKYDGHTTPAGNKVIAESLLDYLETAGLATDHRPEAL